MVKKSPTIIKLYLKDQAGSPKDPDFYFMLRKWFLDNDSILLHYITTEKMFPTGEFMYTVKAKLADDELVQFKLTFTTHSIKQPKSKEEELDF